MIFRVICTKGPALSLTLICLLLLPLSGLADTGQRLSKGQTVYVPIYSHIYSGNREQPIYLAATLSIRNIDPRFVITIERVDYYDSDGQRIKQYINTPVVLNAMSSIRHVIKESDKKGGSGASFIVQWKAHKSVNPPLIESVMISTRSQIGTSFTSRGRTIIDQSP